MLSFTEQALEIFHRQAVRNPVYAKYLNLLDIHPEQVGSLEEIPFLPIRFFKSHYVYAASTPAECVFTSSATTGMTPSRHPVAHLSAYRESLLGTFRQFYGDPSDYVILGLLPSYLERSGSSLVYMVQTLMEQSGHPLNGYYLYDHDRLHATLAQCAATGQKVWLIGVSFALLDFAKNHHCPYSGITVIETGGMKGRGIELLRTDLHARLQTAFPAAAIHSEYSMAEMLSQAYCTDNDGYFACPPQLQVRIRDLQDPFSFLPDGVRGGLNIIDLANADSCAFIETEDTGVHRGDGHFCVLGRIPHAERRGCNMLIDTD